MAGEMLQATPVPGPGFQVEDRPDKRIAKHHKGYCQTMHHGPANWS
jgi:hypothetical protein